MTLPPGFLEKALQKGIEAGNRLNVDEPLLVMPQLQKPAPSPSPPDPSPEAKTQDDV